MHVAMYPKRADDEFSNRIRIALSPAEFGFLTKGMKEPRLQFSGSPHEGVRLFFAEGEGRKVTAVSSGRQYSCTFPADQWGVAPIRGRVRSFSVNGSMLSSASGVELKTKPFQEAMLEHRTTEPSALATTKRAKAKTNGTTQPTTKPRVRRTDLTSKIRRANNALDDFNKLWDQCRDEAGLDLKVENHRVMIRSVPEPETRIRELIASLNFWRLKASDVELDVDRDGNVIAKRRVVTYEKL